MTTTEQALYVRTYGTPSQGRTAALFAKYGQREALAHLTLRVLRASN